DLVLDVGDLGVDRSGDAAALCGRQHVTLVLHVAAGQRGRVRRHLVRVALAEPHVTLDLQAETTVLTVHRHAVVVRSHPGRTDVGVVVDHVAAPGVALGEAAVHAAVRVHQPGRVLRFDLVGD